MGRVGASSGLWNHPEFIKLWAGQTVSQFGSMITGEALPLTALLALNASPAQMGLLASLGSAPVLLIGLLAGVWVDRVRRRRLMVGADLGRAVLLVSIPIAYLLGILRIEQLYIIVFLVGTLSVFFNLAYRSYLPSLIDRQHIVEGNSKLSLSDSVAEVGGPAIGGILVQLITGPIAILIDAVSFLASALFLSSIHSVELPPVPAEDAHNLLHQVTAGLRSIARRPILRALAGSDATLSFFGSFIGALYGLYVIRDLALGPAALGLLVGAGGAGALVGAALNTRITRRLGLGPALIVTLGLTAGLAYHIPFAASLPQASAFVLLLLGQILGDLARAIFTINSVSLRQTITPDAWLGRVNASSEFLTTGIGTLGLLAGGLLGEAIGVRFTLALAVTGMLASILWLLFSPVRRLAVLSPNDAISGLVSEDGWELPQQSPR